MKPYQTKKTLHNEMITRIKRHLTDQKNAICLPHISERVNIQNIIDFILYEIKFIFLLYRLYKNKFHDSTSTSSTLPEKISYHHLFLNFSFIYVIVCIQKSHVLHDCVDYHFTTEVYCFIVVFGSLQGFQSIVSYHVICKERERKNLNYFSVWKTLIHFSYLTV